MAPIRDDSIEVNGVRLDYRECGSASQPAVLILHGLAGNAWEWDPVTESLGERFHVVALNQRGHGSSRWAADYSMSTMAADIAAAIEAMALHRPALIAHSMGGLNAMWFAAEHPAMLDRLVICDVGPDSLQGPVLAGVRDWLAANGDARFAMPDEALAEWVDGSARPNVPLLRHYVDHNVHQLEDGRWAWRYDATGLLAFLDGLPPAEDLWAAVRTIPCPTLVLRAAESWTLSATGAAQLAEELHDGSWVEIPEAGHDLHIEQTERVLSELRSFLG